MSLPRYLLSINEPFCILIQELGVGGEISPASEEHLIVLSADSWMDIKYSSEKGVSLFRSSYKKGRHVMIEMSPSDVIDLRKMKHTFFDRHPVLENDEVIGVCYERKGLLYKDLFKHRMTGI